MSFITSEFERVVGAQIGAVNTAVQDALRSSDFQITSQSLTSISARRGSKLEMGLMGPLARKKVPMVATVSLSPADDGCRIRVHLEDEFNPLFGFAGGVKTRYSDVFAQVQQAIDSALRKLTPAVTGAGSHESSSTGEARFLTMIGERMEKMRDLTVQQGGAVLAGEWRRAKQPWDAIDEVSFESSNGNTVLDNMDVQALVQTGTLILTRPNSLPPNLRTELERFQARLEQALSGRSGRVTVQVSAEEAPVLQFLRQQESLRNQLPVRTLQECTECHTTRMVNPDYQKILKRNQALKNIGGAVGAGISKGSITPFVLFGKVMSFAKLDPNFVCRNCQGMHADESIVTLCPRCGKMQAQAVLKTCTSCGYDFRDALKGKVQVEAASQGQETPAQLPDDAHELAPQATYNVPDAAALPKPGLSNGSELLCQNGHVNAVGSNFCSTCGVALAPPAGNPAQPKAVTATASGRQD